MTTIHTPTLILNPAVAQANIARMAAKARRSGVRLRPHFKTHQSPAIGEWFRAEGIDAITVSSVGMARVFADAGWRDIVIAFPVNWLEIAAINALAAAVRLGLLVESVETARFLAANLTAPVEVWLKVDTGYGRTGLAWEDVETLLAVAEAVQAGASMTLRGLLTHSGHSYGQRGAEAVRALYQETEARLTAARDALAAAGFSGLLLAPGDTPTASVVEDFGAVDEIRPGNFVFYDVMQWEIGACTEAEIAVAVACPVVAVHPERGEIVIYGGAVQLSKEQLPLPDGGEHYGRVALPSAGGWGPSDPNSHVARLSQEHGVIAASAALLARVGVGDVVMVLPVHSCLTANLMGGYMTPEGERIAMMRV